MDVSLRIIQLVKKNPLLFNPKHKYFRNQDKRIEAWDEISQIMELDKNTVRNKWKYARDTYKKYMKNQGKYSVQLRNWPLAEHFEFYKPYLFLTPTHSNQYHKVSSKLKFPSKLKTPTVTTPDTYCHLQSPTGGSYLNSENTAEAASAVGLRVVLSQAPCDNTAVETGYSDIKGDDNVGTANYNQSSKIDIDVKDSVNDLEVVEVDSENDDVSSPIHFQIEDSRRPIIASKNSDVDKNLSNAHSEYDSDKFYNSNNNNFIDVNHQNVVSVIENQYLEKNKTVSFIENQYLDKRLMVTRDQHDVGYHRNHESCNERLSNKDPLAFNNSNYSTSSSSLPNVINNVDAIDLMFLSYAKTIKTFPPQRQIPVRMRINQIILEEELRHHEAMTT